MTTPATSATAAGPGVTGQPTRGREPQPEPEPRRGLGTEPERRAWQLAIAAADLAADPLPDAGGDELDVDDLPDGWELHLADPDEPPPHRLDPDDNLEQPPPPVRPDLRLWPTGQGRIEVEVPGESWLDQQHGRFGDYYRAHVDRLRTVGALLAQQQPTALAARSLPDAFDNLQPMAAKDLAELLDVDASTVSRTSTVVVETPHWQAPLGLFTLTNRPEQISKAARLKKLAAALTAEPDAPNATLARQLTSELNVGESTIRKELSELRALARQPGLVAEHRRWFPRTTWEELRDAAGIGGERGALSCWLILIGYLDVPDLSDTPGGEHG